MESFCEVFCNFMLAMARLTFSCLSIILTWTFISGHIWNNEVDPKERHFYGNECYGRRNGLGLIGNSHLHYERLKRHYSNCTYIRGNLEITHLDDPNILYDLGFLSTIRVVTGYVLIALVTRNVSLSLDNLQLIRGDELFESGSESYCLFIALNSGPGSRSQDGLQTLRMTNLREISNGGVSIVMSPHIPYVQTIQWEIIAPGARVTLQDFSNESLYCHRACVYRSDSHCWGPGSEDCQSVIPVMDNIVCHPSCPGRCYRTKNIAGCCPDVCAGGCFGSKPYQCLTCKYSSFLDTCVRECPPSTFMWAGVCQL